MPRTRLERSPESGEVRVDTSSDPARCEGPEDGCRSGQLHARVEVNDRARAVRGESVFVEKRCRSRRRADAELRGELVAEDLELVLDLAGR